MLHWLPLLNWLTIGPVVHTALGAGSDGKSNEKKDTMNPYVLWRGPVPVSDDPEFTGDCRVVVRPRNNDYAVEHNTGNDALGNPVWERITSDDCIELVTDVVMTALMAALTQHRDELQRLTARADALSELCAKLASRLDEIEKRLD